MSYILDALSKSESERRQGKIPDLGQQMQFVHKPRKKSSPLVVLIAAGLVLNAVVLAVVFWRESAPKEAGQEVSDELVETPTEPVSPIPVPTVEPEPEPEAKPEPALDPALKPTLDPEPEPVAQERPTIIVPSRSSSDARVPVAGVSSGSVRHLVEMPLAFQKSIPDLVFNSHIYASEPSSRRVMINNNYLKVGDSFDGIRVQQITEEGVVLSKSGQSFRVGSMLDWASPK